MSDIKFSCLACGISVETNADMAGQIVNCPSCNHMLKVPTPFVIQPPIADIRAQGFFVTDQPIEPPDNPPPPSYAGIGRLLYFLSMIGIALLGSIFKLGGLGLEISGFCITTLLFLLVTISRLHNIGKSGWWSLMLYVPFVGLIFIALFLAFPEGYADYRKLDICGIIVLVLFVLLVIAMGALIGAYIFSNR